MSRCTSGVRTASFCTPPPAPVCLRRSTIREERASIRISTAVSPSRIFRRLIDIYDIAGGKDARGAWVPGARSRYMYGKRYIHIPTTSKPQGAARFSSPPPTPICVYATPPGVARFSTASSSSYERTARKGERCGEGDEGKNARGASAS
ncbi:hypothetical protein B0H19DRAFT_1184306 [Mycena capillaripes]|nr:hypothetical protein B0H19DRAFT_1184306 [Mycena capillaripes]